MLFRFPQFIQILTNTLIATRLKSSTKNIQTTTKNIIRNSTYSNNKNNMSTSTSTSTSTIIKDLGSVDYLVIGAGAVGMAFVDTLLTLQPLTNVILIDTHTQPGGHWNDAYDYVKLHQPSIVYGVNSKQLEGNWIKLLLLNGQLPWNHHATKSELLTYYQSVISAWKDRLQFFPSTKYDFTQNPNTQDIISFQTISNKDSNNPITTYQVKVNVKVVNAAIGECMVPSKTPPQFSYDPSIKVITPNELYQQYKPLKTAGWLYNSYNEESEDKKFVVIGCGKTGMDAIIYLQTKLHVDPSNIYWIVPRDVWAINRDRAGPSAYHQELLNQVGNHENAMNELEKNKCIYRLDENIRPTCDYKFPTVNSIELKLLRTITNKIRQGRIKNIQALDNNVPVLHFENGTEYKMEDSTVESTIFIHCSSPGPFTKAAMDGDVRLSKPMFDKKLLTLFTLFAPPVPFSASVLAKLESSRRNSTLNVELAKQLLAVSNNGNINDPITTTVDTDTETDTTTIDGDTILSTFIQPYAVGSKIAKVQMLHHYNLAMFLALCDNNPKSNAQYVTKNHRISEFQWLSDIKIIEKLEKMILYSKELGYTDNDTEQLKIVASSLSSLKGM